MPVNFRATALAGGQTLQLFMYDFIGSDFFGDGVTSKMVSDALERAKDATLIETHMDSPGGDAFMGFAIANLLSAHSARKVMIVEGMCASIATAIAAAHDEVHMGQGAQMMIHEAQGGRRGQAHELRACATSLENLNRDIAKVYADRTGKSVDEMLKLMAAETWFTGQQAVEMGFAHKVVNQSKPAKAQARAYARADLQNLGYRNIPAELAAPAQLELTNDPARPTSADEDNMNKILLAKILCISASATDEAFEAAIVALATERNESAPLLAELVKLETATGKKGNEAIGVALAWKASHDLLATAQAELTALKETTAKADLDKAIADAKLAKKLTPAEETTLRAQVEAKELTIKGAKAMLETKAPHAALVDAEIKPAAGGVVIDASTKHNGKLFAEMTGLERADLKRENPELYAAMLKASQD